MNFDTIEGLSYEELLKEYDNVIEDGELITFRSIYATVTCDNGRVFTNKTFCTGSTGYDDNYAYVRYPNGDINDLSKSTGGQISHYGTYWCACMEAGCYDSCTQGQGCKIVGSYSGYCGVYNPMP